MRVAVALVLLAAGCSSAPPSKADGAPKRAPDESYESGGALSWRVLVWKCDERNERVSMTQSCGLTGCQAWHVDRTLCPLEAAGREATRTASECQVEATGKERHPIPEGSGWR